MGFVDKVMEQAEPNDFFRISDMGPGTGAHMGLAVDGDVGLVQVCDWKFFTNRRTRYFLPFPVQIVAAQSSSCWCQCMRCFLAQSVLQTIW